MAKDDGGLIRLDAELIALPTAHLLAAGARGRVIQLFDRSANLVTESDEYFSLLLPGVPLGPFSIGILSDGQRERSFARILGREYHDLKVVANEDELQIGRLHVNLRPARKWNPRLVQGELHGMDLAVAANLISEFLYRHAPADSLPLIFLSGRNAWIATRMGQARRQIGMAIRYAEPGRCKSGAQLAAGVGIGLTPAGDDFLVGVMLALWLSMKDPDPYINSLLDGTRGRTGRLSTAFLEAAARGEAGQTWHHMAQAIAMADAQAIQRATAVLLSTGHTSGADALFGFAGALESTGRAQDFQPELASS